MGLFGSSSTPERPTFLQFNEPPSTILPTAAAFASLDTDGKCSVNIVHGDVANAFFLYGDDIIVRCCTEE